METREVRMTLKECPVVFYNKEEKRFEALIRYKVDDDTKEGDSLGVVISTDDLRHATKNLQVLKGYGVTKFSNIGDMLERYSKINNDTLRDIRTNAGEIVLTDDINFLYLRNTLDGKADNTVKVNFGSREMPELEEITIPSKKPLVTLNGTRGSLKLYGLKDNFEQV